MTAAKTFDSSDVGFGVYLHWPFCAQKCPYCDFNSHVRHKGWDEDRFLAAYKRELDTFAARMPRQIVSSIFFGGGTPSLMQPATVAALLDHIAALWPVAPDVEITLEANPGSVEAARFQGYHAAGVNRVSIGVQSLNDADLKALGRIHSVAEAKAAVALADKTFDRFSFDLIYARPHQTPEVWRQELQQGLAMAGGHLSLYQLTIEDGTPFAERHKRGQLVVPDEDAALALFDITQQLTSDAGLPAYEISNHARAGEESKHNLIYWRYGNYAGVGPGAHGRVLWDGKRQATATLLGPEDWCQAVEQNGSGLRQVQALEAEHQADEFLMMGLRLTEGIDVQHFSDLSGRCLSAEQVSHLSQIGFLEYVSDHFRTDQKRKAVDDVEAKSLFGGEIKACLGPGLRSLSSPERADANSKRQLRKGRLRATPKGRFVLNKIVYQLASSTEPLLPESDAVLSGHVA